MPSGLWCWYSLLPISPLARYLQRQLRHRQYCHQRLPYQCQLSLHRHKRPAVSAVISASVLLSCPEVAALIDLQSKLQGNASSPCTKDHSLQIKRLNIRLGKAIKSTESVHAEVTEMEARENSNEALQVNTKARDRQCEGR